MCLVSGRRCLVSCALSAVGGVWSHVPCQRYEVFGLVCLVSGRRCLVSCALSAVGGVWFRVPCQR